MTHPADTRLATYGTLAPGRINHHELSRLAGNWTTGTVRGRLVAEGWGAAHGCPGLVLDPAGEAVEVHVFTSDAMPGEWARLDAFEGPGYRRVAVTVDTAQGALDAWLYALAV